MRGKAKPWPVQSSFPVQLPIRPYYPRIIFKLLESLSECYGWADICRESRKLKVSKAISQTERNRCPMSWWWNSSFRGSPAGGAICQLHATSWLKEEEKNTTTKSWLQIYHLSLRYNEWNWSGELVSLMIWALKKGVLSLESLELLLLPVSRLHWVYVLGACKVWLLLPSSGHRDNDYY